MNGRKENNTRWLVTAMAAPVTQAASNCSWPVALAVGLLCLGISAGMEMCEIGAVRSKLLAGIQWLWMLMVISEFMHWIMLCWPVHQSYHAVPLIILALAAFASVKGSPAPSAVAGILYYLLIVMLGVVFLSGIKEIKPENLKPQWQMQTAYYILVMLIPAMGIGLGKTEQKGRILIYAIVTAVITSGVLSLELIKDMQSPFYEMSKSLTILGVGRRFESFVAAGMTLGYYVLISYLLNISANVWEKERLNRSIWISAAFSALMFISGMRMNSRLLALGTITIWVLFPILEKIIKILRLPLDKRRMR